MVTDHNLIEIIKPTEMVETDNITEMVNSAEIIEMVIVTVEQKEIS